MNPPARRLLTPEDLVFVPLAPPVLDECVHVATHLCEHLVDRADLHERDPLERFINVLMGEVAERMVLQWLQDHGKFARSAVDKSSTRPDPGHDIEVWRRGSHACLLCSVKSSLAYKLSPAEILQFCKLATKQGELRDINVQVYFWLTLTPAASENRVTVPAIRQSAIMGWFGRHDLKNFSTYQHEQREAPTDTLQHGRPMQGLLGLLA